MKKLIGMVLALACVAGPALAQEKVRFAVGGKSAVFYLPLSVTERLGYFKDAGLDVEIADVASGGRTLQAIIGGSAEIGIGTFDHTIQMQAKGQPVVALLQYGRYPGFVLAMMAGKADRYKSAADLKGMKIGVTGPGSASAIGLAMLLSKAGMTTNDVSIIGVGGGPAAVAAVKTGKLDAIANFDPAISLLQRDAAIRTILDTRHEKDLDYLYGGPFAASAFYADARFIERNPKTVQAFANAIGAALAWLAKASTEEIVAAVPPEYYAGDRELYRAMIESNRERVSPDGRISAEAAERTYRNLAAFEDTIKNAKIDLARTYDNAFVDRAATQRAK